MKKKVLALIMCIVMVIGILPVYAFAESGSDWTYNVLSEDDKTAEITGYTGSETELIFPEEIDGYTMVAIADNAFVSKWSANCPVTEVVIPDSYLRIGEKNFYEYRNLDSIILPHTLVYIGYDCFYHSKAALDFLDNCEKNNRFACFYIGEYCISAQQSQVLDNYKYTIKPGTKLIASGAFFHNMKICGIIIPEGVEYINDYAFYWCTKLTSVVIPNSVKAIGSKSFSDGFGPAIVILQTVENIADDVFSGVEGFTTIFGVPGSRAEELATSNGIAFVAMGDIVYGDVDEDGSVTIADYSETKSYVSGVVEFEGCSEIIGDMNSDCVIDAFDLFQIDKTVNSI